MSTLAKRSRARRAALISAAILGIACAPILAAPGLPATCSKLLELAEAAGEQVGAAEREACEQHYEQLRESRGILGWTRLSWCTRFANTIPEAGEC